MTTRKPHVVNPLLVGSLLASAIVCAPAACHREARSNRPNVVVVVLDTVRPDHLSVYGYARETSPVLRELARDARVFDNAHSVSSWTAPSHASLFTGHFPSTHGLTREHRILDTPLPTLAEILAQHGYETFAVVSNAVVVGVAQYQRGFEAYREPWRDRREAMREFEYRPEEERRRIARSLGTLDRNNLEIIDGWLAERDPDRPFFLFSNLIGPHTPYLSAGPYQNLFDDPIARTSEQQELVRRYGKSFLWYVDYHLGRQTLSDDEIEFLVRHYDAELRYVDHQVGRLIALLREHGVWDDTLFIVTSDHGEGFGEQGILGHELALHGVLTRIPLIVRHPGTFEPGTRESSPVQLVDVFTTVLDIAGIEGISSQGVSLARELDPERPVFSELAPQIQFLEAMEKRVETAEERRRLETLSRGLQALRCGDFKLVRASSGRRAFYDLARDPEESQDRHGDPRLAEEIRACEREMDALVARYTADRPPRSQPPPEPGLDRAHEEALRALGYLE